MITNSNTLRKNNLFVTIICLSLLNSCQEDCYHYKNGQIISIGCFESNLKSGRWITFYENGKVAEIGNYKDGKKQRKWDGWFRNGYQSYNGYFENGQPSGMWHFYYSNGCMRSFGKLEEGYMIGKWTTIHTTGDTTIIHEEGNLKQIIPIDMKYPIQIESSALECEKLGPEKVLDIDSLMNK